MDAAESGDTVSLKAETYFLTEGQLVLHGAVNIEGAGSRVTIIQSNFESRIGYVAPGADITVTGLSAVNGRALEQAPDGGRGISTAGRLHLIESTVAFNSTGAEDAEEAAPGGRR